MHNKLKYGLLIFSLFAITCNAQAYQTLTPHNSSQDSMLKSEQVKSGLKNNWSVKKAKLCMVYYPTGQYLMAGKWYGKLKVIM